MTHRSSRPAQPSLMTTEQFRQQLDENMPEDDFQTQVLELAEKLGWTHRYHAHDSRRSESGFPDLVLVHRRHGVIFAELKSGRGIVSPEQWAWHEVLLQAGAAAYIWRPADWPDVERALRGEA